MNEMTWKNINNNNDLAVFRNKVCLLSRSIVLNKIQIIKESL